MTRLALASALLALLAALVAASPSRADSAASALSDGRYTLVAVVADCTRAEPGEHAETGPRALCATINAGTREEQRLQIAASDWDASLASVKGLSLTLVGTVSSGQLALEAPPRLKRETVLELAVPKPSTEKL